MRRKRLHLRRDARVGLVRDEGPVPPGLDAEHLRLDAVLDAVGSADVDVKPRRDVLDANEAAITLRVVLAGLVLSQRHGV